MNINNIDLDMLNDNMIYKQLDKEALKEGTWVAGGINRVPCVVEFLKNENGEIKKVIGRSENGLDFEMLMGIPINVEILKTFGFEEISHNQLIHNWFSLEAKISKDENWIFSGIYFERKREKDYIDKDGVQIHYSIFKEVNQNFKYVHEYQNLFCEITGLESRKELWL